MELAGLKSNIRSLQSGLLDLLYPPRCMVCGREGGHPLCSKCLDAARPVPTPFCNRCMYSSLVEDVTAGCTQCGELKPVFDKVRAPATFESPIRDAVLALKYGFRESMAQPLGQMMSEYLKSEPFGPETADLIIPVPLHSSRFRERGFNQSEALAREVSRGNSIPMSAHALIRTRRTRPQASLKLADRRANVAGAFAVRDVVEVQGKRVILIDDVLTTLFTANECSRVLRESGAKSIWVLGAAKTCESAE
ncbi:MAG: ComF family protein [Chthonomonadales bacterium]